MPTEGQSIRRRPVFRWFARGIGTVAALFWLLVGILHAVVEIEPFTWESWVLATLIICAAIAVSVAWWRERLGALLILGVGIAHSTFAGIVSGHNHAFAMAITGGPFIVSGVLLLLARRSTRRSAP